jgi:hypothetical protein
MRSAHEDAMSYLGLRAHSPVANPTIDDTADEDSIFAQVSRSLIWAGLGISLLMWAVVGFLLWIPLLVRAIFSFSVSLVHATLTTETADRAGMVVKDAINFYRRGFIVAFDAVHGTAKPDLDDLPPERAVSSGSAINELTWAAISWYFLLLFLGIIETSPLDVFRAVASQPWGEMLNASADSFNAWVAETFPKR